MARDRGLEVESEGRSRKSVGRKRGDGEERDGKERDGKERGWGSGRGRKRSSGGFPLCFSSRFVSACILTFWLTLGDFSLR